MSAISLRGILETNKLVGPNFDDWYRNLRIVLRHEKLIDVIDKPTKEVLDEDDDDATKIYQKYLEKCLTTKCIILVSMNSELQRKHQDMDPTAIIEHLKNMFGTQSRTTRYQLSKALFGSKLTGNSPIGPYVNHMIDLIEELEKLGCKLESFSQFVINLNMNKMDCDLHEMLKMLIDYENQLASKKKKGTVMLVRNSSKKKGKGKSKPKKKAIAPKGGCRHVIFDPPQDFLYFNM
ncbi:uncharacterized protein [Nicotiana sylvestris]|uniref:uncharacterized protein n=1 Tax=Nicotiana sylvestris TaxID=4096 RepID=UPI00388C3926